MQIGFAGLWRKKEVLDSEGCGLGEGSGLTYLPGSPPGSSQGPRKRDGWSGGGGGVPWAETAETHEEEGRGHGGVSQPPCLGFPFCDQGTCMGELTIPGSS